MAPRRRVRTQPARQVTVVIAVVLWLIGFLAVILHVITLPQNLGVWALALAGLIMILGSIMEGI